MPKAIKSKAVKVPGMRGRPSARDAILDAAEAVVVDGGAPALTLDSAARRAGVSKGGVLYHFPTKESLLRGMVERLIERTETAHRAMMENQPHDPRSPLKAYVKNSVSDPGNIDMVSGSLLAAVADDTKLLDPVREFFLRRLPQITAGLAFERAAVIHAATEGLWLMEVLRISPFTSAQRKKLAMELMRMADEV
jgi:AcrR family transcriptional regulator